MDNIERWFNLVIPVLLTVSGLYAVLIAVIGSPKHYEDNPRMADQLRMIGKTKARIVHAVIGAGILCWGLWLLHGWLFVPQ